MSGSADFPARNGAVAANTRVLTRLTSASRASMRRAESVASSFGASKPSPSRGARLHRAFPVAFFQGFRVLGFATLFQVAKAGPMGRASERGAGVNPRDAPRARAVDRPMDFEPWNPDFPNRARPRSTRRFDPSATSPRPLLLSIFFLSGPSPRPVN